MLGIIPVLDIRLLLYSISRVEQVLVIKKLIPKLSYIKVPLYSILRIHREMYKICHGAKLSISISIPRILNKIIMSYKEVCASLEIKLVSDKPLVCCFLFSC